MTRYKAVLLIGPTGSGKTPLGDICEEKGLWGRRCAHFDFGASLRKIADTGQKPSRLTDEDMEVVASVLRSGALLENENFHIAKSILLSFAEEKKLKKKDGLLLLNGMPRHARQADDVDEIADVRAVVLLKCTPAVVSERIKLNSGGDRVERVDDSPEEVDMKLRIFGERTVPLIEHYRGKGAVIEEFEVSIDTVAEEIYEWLEGRTCRGL